MVLTPGHALRYNGMYPQEGCRILIDGSGSDSSTVYQAYNGTTPDTIGYYINTSLVIINNGTGIEYSGWITDYSRGNHSSSYFLGDILHVLTIQNIMNMKDTKIHHIFMIGE